MPKKTAARERTAFGMRMYQSRKHKGLTQEAVKALLRVAQSTVAEAEKEAESSGYVAEFATLYEVDSLWLSTGQPPAPNWFNPTGPEPLRRDDISELSFLTRPDQAVAHGMSLSTYTVPPLMSWEAVVKKQELPAQFTLDVPDNALAPNAPKGTPLIFDRTAQPRPGYAVIVEDSTGTRWVRRYKQEPDGAWLAEAVNPAYATLDPAKHGLTIVAAMLFKDAAL